ncbi:hypothetical protein AMJ39_08280 [candidate division TA06 bacterium DG_24]|uniref:Prepilin leader peptidase/N-methyltransferase n=3 Tax=Bacteria division TA06 TaxID=1156500 RepID=A0A0S8JHE3_UNCT6|nr:MAG: hypothetical protein AMJ39_08280 [candidate division TA06 bacterium DG_24]KPK67764.1 MAG: hypothetical protein AMJ82_09910 [candidate division TA06 bacterium SM23_40]KPL09111.1 MAG: hypothetical protein AMJ71_07290 [candidate division TA06 bacterium SM1_40]
MTATLAFLFGLALGSFVNVVIYRLPRRMSLVRPRSLCPECGTPIRARDNIPLLSYLLLRGRCRDCGARIEARYPLVELAAGLLVVGIYLKVGLSPALVLYGIFALILLAIFFIDLATMLIPDRLTLPGIGIALIWHVVFDRAEMLQYLVGLLLGGGLLLIIVLVGRLVYRQEAMGLGDVKLAAMVGAFLGWRLTLISLYLSFAVGALWGLALLMAGRAGRRSSIPFGPFIAVASIVALFWGEHLLRYVGILLRG